MAEMNTPNGLVVGLIPEVTKAEIVEETEDKPTKRVRKAKTED